MFASKPLSERNNDPHPNVWDQHSERDQMRADTDKFRMGCKEGVVGSMVYVRRPRPEFQYGKLPANPILVMARQAGSHGHLVDFAEGFLDDPLDSISHPHVTHAHRVLTLLATLTNGVTT